MGFVSLTVTVKVVSPPDVEETGMKPAKTPPASDGVVLGEEVEFELCSDLRTDD
jgi:hypothetical protein